MFKTLVSHIVDRAEPVFSSSLSLEVITVFQYYNYFASKNVSDLTNYVLQLAREGKQDNVVNLKKGYPCFLKIEKGEHLFPVPKIHQGGYFRTGWSKNILTLKKIICKNVYF